MLTPPHSPMPLPQGNSASPSSTSPQSTSLKLKMPEDDLGYPLPPIPASTSSPSTAEIGSLQKSLSEAKKRTGRGLLLVFVVILPIVLILSTALHSFLRMPFLDHRPPIIMMTKRDHQGSKSSPSPTPTASASTPVSSSQTPSSGASTVPPIPSSPPVLPTPLPQPFDLTLASNFSTQSCDAFFNDFTQEEDFRQCRAFSFLLNTSAGFLDAQHNLTLFNNILWATCNTPRTADDCAATMSNYLSRLNSACHTDIADENQNALQAQIGFESYTAMRTAACLEDANSQAYCYMEAVAASSPADIYFYALPLGTPVPPSTQPSCSACVKSVLAVYAEYVTASPKSGIQVPSGTGNSTFSTQPQSPLPVLSKVYPAAAKLAVNQCGGTYASVGIATGTGFPRAGTVPWRLVLFALVVSVAL